MLEKLKKFTETVKYEIRVWKWIIKDKRTPLLAKILLGVAIGYTLFPIDLIPDFIPGVGYLDDILLVGGMIWIALKLIPKEVVEEARIKAR